MRKGKKSGRITLRVDPAVHQELSDVTQDLGLDVNGLLNLLIRRALGEAAAEARLCKLYREGAMSEGTFTRLLAAWRKAHPQGRLKDFLAEFRKHVLGEPNELDGVTPAGGGGAAGSPDRPPAAG